MSTSECSAGAPRVAVVGQGDVTDRGLWSGIPAGICAGLREAGAEPVPIDSRPPAAALLGRALRRPHWRKTSPLYAGASGAWASRAIRSRAVDGIVLIGSACLVRSAAPVVSFDDMTVAQGVRTPWSPVSSLPAADAARWRRRQAEIYRRSRACCVCSEWAASSVRDDYRIAPERIAVVGLGRNVEPEPAAERDWSVPRFLFLGLEWERKGGPELIDAFAALRARHPEASLDLVGGHPARIDAAGVRGHGRLSLAVDGDRRRIAALLATATCLVLPSGFEAFGIVHVEAGAAGVPSIGSSAGGAADAIGDGGLVVDPGDRAALVAAMSALCDPLVARRLGSLARRNAERFTWPAVAGRLLAALGLDQGRRDPARTGAARAFSA